MASDGEFLREQLLKQVGEAKLEEMLNEKEKRFHGLLTREAALFALSKEMEIRLPERQVSLSEASGQSRNAFLRAKVKRVFETFNFEKNGRKGKGCRVLLEGDGEEATIVLWNKDVDYVDKAILVAGDTVEVRGFYLKNDELHLGYGGKITVIEKAREKTIKELSDGDEVNLLAKIVENEGTRRYERDGEMREMGSCIIDDGSGPSRLLLWEGNARVLEGAAPGDNVQVRGARFRNGEMHAGRSSTVRLIRTPITPEKLTADFEGELEGKVNGIAPSEGGLIIALEGGDESRVLLPGDLSFRFLGVKSIPGDVKLETVVKLKERGLLGKTLRVKGRALPSQGRILFQAEGMS